MRLIGLVLALSLTLAPLGVDAQQAAKIAKIGVLFSATPAPPRISSTPSSKGCGSLAMSTGKRSSWRSAMASPRSNDFPNWRGSW